MATAAVSSSSLQQTLESYVQQRGTDLQQLGQALESGDLTAAQSAYSALKTLAQNGPFSDSHAFNLMRRQSEFAAIGRDLESGNLTAARRAFAELRGNRASDPAGAEGSQTVPPAVVIEISVQGAAAADAAASSAAASTATPASAAPAPTVATPILTAAPVPTVASSILTAVPTGAVAVPPPPEVLINLTLGGGNSGGIEIDLTLPNPVTPAPTTAAPPSSAASSTTASSSAASPAATAGASASAAAGSTPEIVVNLNAGSLAAGSEITIGVSQSANGGEQFSLGIGTQANPSQEQINISLAQSANEQIVLNLLGAGSGGAASSAPGTLINISI
jgi:hypothetical protein